MIRYSRELGFKVNNTAGVERFLLQTSVSTPGSLWVIKDEALLFPPFLPLWLRQRPDGLICGAAEMRSWTGNTTPSGHMKYCEDSLSSPCSSMISKPLKKCLNQRKPSILICYSTVPATVYPPSPNFSILSPMNYCSGTIFLLYQVISDQVK